MNLVFRFGEDVFAAVVEANVLASVLIAVVAVVQWTMGRKLGPNWRFALWGIVLVRLLLPVAPESRLSLFNAREWIVREQAPQGISPALSAPVVAPEAAVEATPFESEVNPAQVSAAEIRRELPWKAGLILLWTAGVVFILTRLGVGAIWLAWRVRREGWQQSNSAAQVILERSANEIGTRWRARLIECDLVGSPAVFGLFRPKLLVPRGLLERLSAGELRHVFLHELAHLKRGDLFVNALMAIAQAVHWMNPLVWLAMRQMRVERELACDEMALRVVRGENESRAYGETILRLLEGVPVRRRLPALVGIAEEKHSARKRLAQIAVFHSARKRRGVLGIGIVAVVGFCGLTNAKMDGYRNHEDAALRDALEIQTAVERLMNDTKRKMETGELEGAEANLKQAKKLAPNHREVQYYLRLVEERRYAQETDKRSSKTEADARNSVSNRAVQANPYARANRIDSSPGRQAIVRKLQEIRFEDYSVPESVKLSEVIKDIDRTARKLDPEKKGVNFVLSAQLGDGLTPKVDPASGVAPVKVGDYLVEITPALRDVTLLGLVDAIMHVAVPPKGYESAPRLKYVIEDYALVIGQRGNEREQLYTRTFKINPNTVLQGLDLRSDPQMQQQAVEPGRLSRVQQAVRNYFEAAGLDFSTNRNAAMRPGESVPPQKALFYNDRTGILMARASLSDLEILERAVQALEAKAPQQVVFTVEFVEIRNLGKLAELLGDAAEGGQFSRTAITSPEYRELKRSAEGRFKFEQMPRVTTLVSRPARVGIEGRGDIDLNTYYDAAEKTIEVTAKWFTEAEKHSPPTKGTIYDGQTFLLLPKESQRRTQPEVRRRYGLAPETLPLQAGRVAFITVDVIDPAGNKVNKDDEFIQKTSSAVPKQRQ